MLYQIYEFCRIPFLMLPAYFVALCCIALMIGTIKFPFIKRKKNVSFKQTFEALDFPFGHTRLSTVLICFLCCFIILFSHKNFLALIGSKDIRIMPSGTYCYYVYATNEKDKTYTLPANIEKINNEYYVVHNVYFKNGGYLYFEDCEYFKFTEKESTYDQNGNNWNLKLTNIKANHKNVKETKTYTFTDFIGAIVSIFAILFSGTMYFIYNKKKKYEV